MNSSNTKNKVKTAMIAVSAAVLAVGCSSTSDKHQAKYYSNQAPLAMSEQAGSEASMGGTGSSVQTQSGGGASSQASAGANDIVIPLQQEQLRVGTQQSSEGSVRIHKTVTTETVSQPVQVRRESVSVERLPAGAQASASQGGAQSSQGSNSLATPFQEGEMTINLTKEQPIAMTQVVPAGSVVVHRQITSEPVNVQAQIRREDVQAVPVGNPQNVSISSNLNSSAQGVASSGGSASNEAQGAAPSSSGQSAGAGSSSSTITDISQLSTGADPASMAGRQVNLNNVKVQKVAGDRLIAVGPDGSKPIYVRTAQPVAGITPGQTVNLKGSVRPVPQTTSSLGLDQQSSQQLQGETMFIDVITITPSGQQ